MHPMIFLARFGGHGHGAAEFAVFLVMVVLAVCAVMVLFDSKKDEMNK